MSHTSLMVSNVEICMNFFGGIPFYRAFRALLFHSILLSSVWVQLATGLGMKTPLVTHHYIQKNSHGCFTVMKIISLKHGGREVEEPSLENP